MPEPLPDLYKALGLKRWKTPNKLEIISRFRWLAQHAELPHPDKTPGSYAADVYGATAVLTDDVWREFYDRYECMPTVAHKFYQDRRLALYDIALTLRERYAKLGEYASPRQPAASTQRPEPPCRQQNLEELCNRLDALQPFFRKLAACGLIAMGIYLGVAAIAARPAPAAPRPDFNSTVHGKIETQNDQTRQHSKPASSHFGNPRPPSEDSDSKSK